MPFILQTPQTPAPPRAGELGVLLLPRLGLQNEKGLKGQKPVIYYLRLPGQRHAELALKSRPPLSV
jgi:hypothetical protein